MGCSSVAAPLGHTQEALAVIPSTAQKKLLPRTVSLETEMQLPGWGLVCVIFTPHTHTVSSQKRKPLLWRLWVGLPTADSPPALPLPYSSFCRPVANALPLPLHLTLAHPTLGGLPATRPMEALVPRFCVH